MITYSVSYSCMYAAAIGLHFKFIFSQNMISSFSLAKTGVLLLLLAPNLQKHAKTKKLKNWQIPNRFQSLSKWNDILPVWCKIFFVKVFSNSCWVYTVNAANIKIHMFKVKNRNTRIHLCQSLFFNKKDSGTGVFLWILWNFWEHLFLQNAFGGCFLRKSSFEKIFIFIFDDIGCT